MKFKEIHKFVIKTTKGNKVIETTATESELKDLYYEYQLNINQLALPELKNKTLVHDGKGTRPLNQAKLKEHLEDAKNLDNIRFFRDFMKDKGFIFATY